VSAPYQFDGAQIRVVGLPVQQGSKGARARMVGTKLIAELFDTNAGTLKPWRRNVAGVARLAAQQRAARNLGPLDGPLHCAIVFRFPMPQSRPKADFVRGWCWKVSVPDADKLTRACFDSITSGGLIHDDARIVSFTVVKVETVNDHEVGCSIQVHTIDPNGAPPPVRPLEFPPKREIP